MILVSCRRNFDSNELFGDTCARSYESLQSLDHYVDMSLAQAAEEAKDKHVLILVHGFHNSLASVAAAYADVESKLLARKMLAPGSYDMVIGFAWPGFATDAGFFPAIPSANRSGARLRSFISLLNSTAHTVDMQTHSLGARVGLEALSFAPEVFIDNLMLTAPAVDDEVLEPKREFNAALKSCRRCLVYWSINDPVLKTAYRLAEWDYALGWHGPQDPDVVAADCPDVYTVDCSAIVQSHGGYRDSDEVYAQWALVLAEAPIDRVEVLRKAQ